MRHDVVPEPVGEAAAKAEIFERGLRGDDETRRDWNPDTSHLTGVRALAAQQADLVCAAFREPIHHLPKRRSRHRSLPEKNQQRRIATGAPTDDASIGSIAGLGKPSPSGGGLPRGASLLVRRGRVDPPITRRKERRDLLHHPLRHFPHALSARALVRCGRRERLPDNHPQSLEVKRDAEHPPDALCSRDGHRQDGAPERNARYARPSVPSRNPPGLRVPFWKPRAARGRSPASGSDHLRASISLPSRFTGYTWSARSSPERTGPANSSRFAMKKTGLGIA